MKKKVSIKYTNQSINNFSSYSEEKNIL
jgi:hypothetical protein